VPLLSESRGRGHDLSPLNAFLPGEIPPSAPKTWGPAIESDGPDLTDESPGVLLSAMAVIAQPKGRYRNIGNQPDPDHPNNPQANLFLVACGHAPA
jgi:hypothetical protein